jgi:hypothetical protein
MKKNIGNYDVYLRLILGVVFVSLFATGSLVGGFSYVLLLLGLVLVSTAWFRYCPIYSLFGINTCKK